MPSIQRLTSQDINHPEHIPQTPEIIMGFVSVAIAVSVALVFMGCNPLGRTAQSGAHAA